MKRMVCSWLSLVIVLAATVSASQTLKPRRSDDSPANSLDRRVAELSEQISTEMTENRKKVIAVVEFADLKGNITDFGRLLSEELITRLFQTKKFTVIERQMLNKVIAEQKLTLTGVFDQSSARQLGRLLGVDAICSGTITDLSQNLRVNAWLISTETGEIFAVAATEIQKDDSVARLLGANTSGASSNSNNSSDTKQPSPPAPIAKPPVRFNTKEFLFEATTCNLSVNSLTCNFAVENESSTDRLLVIYFHSKMFDGQGKEYRASKIRFGNNTATQEEVRLVLVPNIKMKGTIRFDNFNADVTSIVLLRMVCSHGKPNAFNVELWETGFDVNLRNIPITK
jgi:TolB-like protein